jgi:hypothetical protein
MMADPHGDSSPPMSSALRRGGIVEAKRLSVLQEHTLSHLKLILA